LQLLLPPQLPSLQGALHCPVQNCPYGFGKEKLRSAVITTAAMTHPHSTVFISKLLLHDRCNQHYHPLAPSPPNMITTVTTTIVTSSPSSYPSSLPSFNAMISITCIGTPTSPLTAIL
jgi:hypothetical protein